MSSSRRARPAPWPTGRTWRSHSVRVLEDAPRYDRGRSEQRVERELQQQHRSEPPPRRFVLRGLLSHQASHQ